MLEAIERTNGYVARGRGVFLSDYDTRELVIHHLEHLAESADQASQRFKRANPLVPWPDLRELRNLLVHQDMRPQPDRVWAFVTKQLPLVERRLRRARFTEPDAIRDPGEES